MAKKKKKKPLLDNQTCKAPTAYLLNSNYGEGSECTENSNPEKSLPPNSLLKGSACK